MALDGYPPGASTSITQFRGAAKCRGKQAFPILNGTARALVPRASPQHLDPIDVVTFQHRLGIALSSHFDHGAADLFSGGHVCRRQAIEQRPWRRSPDIDRLDPAGL